MTTEALGSVLLIGTPNSGKTALFNCLTGSRQKVANYSGVTVSAIRALCQSPHLKAHILDLPGCYGLSHPWGEEKAVLEPLLEGRCGGQPTVLVCVADACRLEFTLKLVLEAQNVGLPVVVACTMWDVAQKNGVQIDFEGLSSALGAPVLPVCALSGYGLQGLLETCNKNLANRASPPPPLHAKTPQDLYRAASALAAAHVTQTVMASQKSKTAAQRVDDLLLHPLLGPLVLVAVLWAVFESIFHWAQGPQEALQKALFWTEQGLAHLIDPGPLRSLVCEGILGGVGSVVVFLPQILMLFFWLSILEESGYMARAAFLLDGLMGRVGLSGKALIPLLSGHACAIPALMAARTIDNRAHRLATMLALPLTTCSARLPVYTMLIGAFVPPKTLWGPVGLRGVVLLGLYLGGLGGALAVAALARRTVLGGAAGPLVLELPPYRMPHWRSVAHTLVLRGSGFVTRAGTVILCLMVVMWALVNIPLGNSHSGVSDTLGWWLGHKLEPLMAPLGFPWQVCFALLPGLAAREVLLGVLGTVYAMGRTAGPLDSWALAPHLAQNWPLSTGLSLLAWYVFAPQCLPTFAVAQREMGGWRWAILMFAYMLALAYGAAWLVNTLTQGWGPWV